MTHTNIELSMHFSKIQKEYAYTRLKLGEFYSLMHALTDFWIYTEIAKYYYTYEKNSFLNVCISNNYELIST